METPEVIHEGDIDLADRELFDKRYLDDMDDIALDEDEEAEDIDYGNIEETIAGSTMNEKDAGSPDVPWEVTIIN